MIQKRKQEHVKLCLEKNVQASRNYFDLVKLLHCALPEIDKKEISVKAKIFKTSLKAPIIITGMTGGFAQAELINKNLAQAAEELGLGLGIGSERAALERKSLERTYSVIKNYKIPFVLANLGAAQVRDLSSKKIKKIIELVNADCFAIHLNFLQEVVQLEGEPRARGCWKAIQKLSYSLATPIILKETGAGISYELALKAKKLNLGIDVAGAGGTSFAAVEYYRARTKLQKRLGKTFWDWGIPTPVSILNCKKAKVSPIIGSGGIRTGLDGAKALALGSDVFGLALPLLKPAVKSAKAVVEELEIIIEELKAAMFLVGAKNIKELKEKPVRLGQVIRDYL